MGADRGGGAVEAGAGREVEPMRSDPEPLKVGFAGLVGLTRTEGRVLFHARVRPDMEEEREDEASVRMDSHVRAWSSAA